MTKLDFHHFQVRHFNNIFEQSWCRCRVGATPARRSNCLQTRRIHHQVKYRRLNANTCIVAAILFSGHPYIGRHYRASLIKTIVLPLGTIFKWKPDVYSAAWVHIKESCRTAYILCITTQTVDEAPKISLSSKSSEIRSTIGSFHIKSPKLLKFKLQKSIKLGTHDRYGKVNTLMK